MSTALATAEDFKFFDFLAPYRWPYKTKKQIAEYRELVADGDLQIETVLENALVQTCRGAYTRVAEKGRDFCDGGDAKKSISQFRNNDIARDLWTNSFAISGLSNKTGVIRAVCYSREQDKFYFFAIPYKAYKGMARVDILLDNSVGYREPKGIPKGKWTRYMVPTFEILTTIDPKEVNKL
jgi:hypothetical protein